MLAGAATIELVTAVLGGEIGPRIVGLFTGRTAGWAVTVSVALQWSARGADDQAVLLAYDRFGLTVLGLALLSHVHFPVIARYLGFRLNLAVAALAAIAIGLGAWQRRGRLSV
ncbi:MAG: hypothetical protein ABEH59_01230 [Halobacteriales archaeon]